MPEENSEPLGPPHAPPDITVFAKEVATALKAPTVSVAVEVAVMHALDVLVGELEPARKVTVATYPSPVTL